VRKALGIAHMVELLERLDRRPEDLPRHARFQMTTLVQQAIRP
jgi:hypothetical protein